MTDPNSDLHGFTYASPHDPTATFTVVGTWPVDSAYVEVRRGDDTTKPTFIRTAASVRRRKEIDNNDGA